MSTKKKIPLKFNTYHIENNHFIFDDFIDYKKDLRNHIQSIKSDTEIISLHDVDNYDSLMNDDVIRGCIVKNNVYDIPPGYDSRNKESNALELRGDNKGIGHDTVFYYIKSRQILIYEVSRAGVSINQFLDFLENYHRCDPIRTSYVLNEIGINNLNQYASFSSLTYGIKGMYNHTSTTDINEGAEEDINRLIESNSNNIEVKLTVGRNLSRSQSHGFIRKKYNGLRSIINFFHRNSNTLDIDSDNQPEMKMKVKGKRINARRSEEIDLVMNRLKFKCDLIIQSKLNSEIKMQRKYIVVTGEFNNWYNQIISIYR